MYCGEHTAVKRSETELLAVTLPCNSWTCPDCADKRKDRLICQAIGGKPDTFITMTSRRVPGRTDQEAAALMSNAWKILRKRMEREAKRDPEKNPRPFGAAPEGGWKVADDSKMPRQVVLPEGTFHFLLVVERHQSEWPHFHILGRSRWIGWKWLSAQLAELCDGPVVSITRIDGVHRCVSYCSAYAGKCSEKIGTTKRYWQSKGYDQRPKEEREKYRKKQPGWTVERGTVWEVVDSWQCLGAEVEWLEWGKAKIKMRGAVW